MKEPFPPHYSLESEKSETLTAASASIFCRGIRGATTIEKNTSEEILKGTRELLALIIRFNQINKEDIASVIFTTTKDINAAYPALAARQLGWIDTPLMCGHEMEVPGSLQKCIRVLIHWNTHKSNHEIRHVYIKGAQNLRPDWADLPQVDWEELNLWIEKEIASASSLNSN